MNGEGVVVRSIIDQMMVTNLFDKADFSCFKKIVNLLSLMAKARMERAAKSAN
jgi:hypothetical protein